LMMDAMNASSLLEMINARRVCGGTVDCVTLNPDDVDHLADDLSKNSTGIYTPSDIGTRMAGDAVMWLFGIPVYESRNVERGSVVWGRL
jgi:hypothetical protein